MAFRKKYGGTLIMLAVFEVIAVTLWLAKDNLFYLVNFSSSAAPSPWAWPSMPTTISTPGE